jgi:hypothetical protein
VSFIQDVSRLATEAEKGHGVPAAALAAMAALESGSGWTRTAINANNLFGWKYVSDQASGGRGFWVLECQPPEDRNNRYVVFADWADAVDFVAWRLATSDHYRADTARYQKDRAAAVDLVEAVDRWVEGIADPYNWEPEEYSHTLRRIMNDPYDPSDWRSPQHNLYHLSEAAPAMPGQATSNASDEALAEVSSIIDQYDFARYMEENCRDVDWPSWEGFPTKECRYAQSEIPGGVRVILLNPGKDQLAAWITSACTVAQTNDYEFCARKLADHINQQSGAQFPVAGIVMEDQRKYAFRDGVTVGVAGIKNDTEGYPTAAEQEAALTAPVRRVAQYARIQSTTRDQYTEYAGKGLGREPEDVTGLKWQEVIRRLYQQAWKSDSYVLMDAWAHDNQADLGR